MKRGEIHRGGRQGHAGRPRPVSVVQTTASIRQTQLDLRSRLTLPTPLLRIAIEPNESNGLRAVCRLMVDKITTVPEAKIRTPVGRLADEDMIRLNRALLVFLGLPLPPK